MEIKEIKIEDNCLVLMFEDRYITFSLKDIKSIDNLIDSLNWSKESLIKLGKK